MILLTMSKCPPGFICFNHEVFLFVILAVIGLVIYGVSRGPGSGQESPTHSSHMSKGAMQHLRQEVRQEVSTSLQDHLPPPHANPYAPLSYSHVSPASLSTHHHTPSYDPPPAPPTRSYPSMSINVPTRGDSGEYQQIGALYRNGQGKSQVLPLYGRPMHPGASKWQYYTSTDSYHSIRVPVFREGRKCQGGFGCEELYDGDLVTVEPYKCKFRVSLYELEQPRYLPHVF